MNERLALVLIAVGLVAAVWLIYAQTLRFGFVNFDDGEYVYETPRITAGLTLAGVKAAFTQVHAANWHPLTTLSHMLDCQLFGLAAGEHHFANVLLHTLATVLLFFALRALTQTIWPSALVAALFAVHPLRVESVAWISERKDVLSAVFFALTLWAYARYVRGERRRLSYVAVVVSFALGLLAKPTLVTLPFVLLLLDYWPLRRLTRSALPSLLLEKVPLFLLTLGSCAATLIAQKHAITEVRDLTFAERVGNAFLACVTYVWQTFVPVNLAALYPYQREGVEPALYAFAILAVLGVSAGCSLARKSYPFLLVGWLWFIGMLVPMIGLVQVGSQAHADRYTYLAGIGLAIAIVWSGFAFLRPRLLVIASAVALVALTAVSFLQAASWRNSETLWRHALAVTTENHVAENNLGKALLDQHRFDEAVPHLRNALEIYPSYPEARNNLSVALAGQGNLTEASAGARAAVQARPEYAKAHSNLGVTLAQTGKLDEARREFEEAIRLDPNYVDAHANFAHLLLMQGRRADAAEQLRAALRLAPDDVELKAQLRELER